MSDPDKPVRFSPTRTFIASVGGVTVRVKQRTWAALLRLVALPAFKLFVAGVAVLAAAIAAWEC